MTPDTTPQSVLFPDLFDKPLVATFNQEHASSDGGAVLLKAAERVYGLVKAFARCLADKRAPGKIRHTLADLIGQRVFGIACGHPDGNDADHLANDPIHKLLLGRDPVSGARLASQPTISRFENGARRTVLYRMGRALAASVIERHRRRLNGRARRITIDLDPTDDLTHGAQQLTFFNGHYGGWCYLPMLGFLSFDREAEQYLCAAVLRPGKAVAADGTLGLLSRLLPLLRAAFPRARFLVRLDGGFATPEIFDFLDAEPRLDYVVAMAKNAVLQRHAESAMQVARAQSEVRGETAHVYTDTRYAAGIGDRRVLRLITKWLNAGVMENGEWKDDLQGTPQGAVVSPILANVYLHYVLDLWFQKKWRARKATGDTIIVRYADDFVVGCQRKADAGQFLRDLKERLGQFALDLHPDKTRLIEFGRFATAHRRARGERRPETFDFLGFTHYCRKTRNGGFGLGRKPIAKRVTRTLKRLKERLRVRLHEDVHETAQWLGKVVNGWLNYYAVPTSSRTLGGFVRRLEWIWLATLRRRSQRTRTTIAQVTRLTALYWPPARVRHPWPNARFAVNHPR